MFGFIKENFIKIYNQFTAKASQLFSRTTIDQSFMQELTDLFISADTGIVTTKTIMDQLTISIKQKSLSSPQEIKAELKQILLSILTQNPAKTTIPAVCLLVGINGSGKTTFAAKLAHKLKKDGKKVLLLAGDTFRAAATEQLDSWAKKINVDILIGKENQDPASLIFDGCKKLKEYDHLIIDTAGRLQTKVNLMKELSKIKKILSQNVSEYSTWLTIDAMLGQNSFEQAKIFHEISALDGIILSKLDGTGKGGIVFSITNQLHLPIIYVTFGEDVDALAQFNPQEYVNNLLE